MRVLVLGKLVLNVPKDCGVRLDSHVDGGEVEREVFSVIQLGYDLDENRFESWQGGFLVFDPRDPEGIVLLLAHLVVFVGIHRTE